MSFYQLRLSFQSAPMIVQGKWPASVMCVGCVWPEFEPGSSPIKYSAAILEDPPHVCPIEVSPRTFSHPVRSSGVGHEQNQ